MLRYSCPDIENFDKYMNEYTNKLGSTTEFYLSHKGNLSPNQIEKLDEHIVQTVKQLAEVRHHLQPIGKLIKLLEYTISGNLIDNVNAYNVAQYAATFIAFYHDIGKAEISYQLYAHDQRSTVPPPHNYSSVAFLIHSNNDNIYLEFVKNIVAKGLSLRTADTLYLASLIAIVMHHEYYDYKDLSFIEVLTPSTLYLAKGVKHETILCFHATVYDIIDNALKKLKSSNIPKPLISSKTDISISFSEVVEYIASLHYEFGALRIEKLTVTGPDKRIELALSLAEALTWVLVLADNLAAQYRGRCEDERSFFANEILKWY
ncbi:MAG: hypothetical protein QW607_11540 [Desulfurococcaceae archaeon]